MGLAPAPTFFWFAGEDIHKKQENKNTANLLVLLFVSSPLSRFCGYNNVVIGAKKALDAGTQRILIVDFDLHHGQGTQRAFYADPRVLYMSVHRYEEGRFWPHLRESNFDWVGEGEGLGFNVNLPLNVVGCGPTEYLTIFNRLFLPIATEYRPDLVIVSAGMARQKCYPVLTPLFEKSGAVAGLDLPEFRWEFLTVFII